MIEEHTEEEASLYVLGLLPTDEARKFEAAIAADPELAALVARLETGASALAWTALPRDPPPALRSRVMDRIKPDEAGLADRVVPFRSRWTWIPWAAAACLAFTTAGLAYERFHLKLVVDAFVLRDHAQQEELDRVQTSETVLQDRLEAARGEVAQLKARNALAEIKIATLASMVPNAPQAMAVVAWDGGAQRGVLKTLNMPAARPDQDYQLWIVDPGYKQPVSAGIFNPAAPANFEPVHPISKVSKFCVSLEKKGGSAEPQGTVVLVGE